MVAAVQANAAVNGDTSIELYRLAWQALPDDMSGLGRSTSVSFRRAGTGCRGLWRTPGRNDVWCAGPQGNGPDSAVWLASADTVGRDLTNIRFCR